MWRREMPASSWRALTLRSKIFAFPTCLWLLLASPALSATPLTKVVVGYAAMNGRVAPLWIADEQGFLAKYGLQADQVYVRGAPLLVAGMASGDIQFGRSGGSATLAGRWRRPRFQNHRDYF